VRYASRAYDLSWSSRSFVSGPAYQPRYSFSTVPCVSVVSTTRAGPYSDSANSRISIWRLSFERIAGVRSSAFSPARITSAWRFVSGAGRNPTRAYSAVVSIQRSAFTPSPGT
jgi:hypothetical protein